MRIGALWGVVLEFRLDGACSLRDRQLFLMSFWGTLGFILVRGFLRHD